MKKHFKIIISLLIILVVLFIAAYSYYIYQLSPVSNSKKTVEITIPNNTMGSTIAMLLKEKKLIRNQSIFKIYLRLHNVNNLKSGIYELSPNMDVKEIVAVITEGRGSQIGEINILFPEGKNIRQIATIIEQNTNNKKEDVYKLLEDNEYIDGLIEKYWFLTPEIKNKDIYYPLEGYLAPNTYRFRSKDVTIKEIFTKMLDQNDKILTPYKDKIIAHNFTVHEFLTLASIVEIESVNNEDRAVVAGVFYNRLERNEPLGSCVTTYYAIKLDNNARDLYQSEIDRYNPYNTRGTNAVPKLPIGPVANPGEDSIKATAEPTDTNFMFFVADKNNKVYFTKTFAEHQHKINELKAAGLWPF